MSSFEMTGRNTGERNSFLYGLGATALLVLIWGIQPFFMKVALEQFDSFTISWFRMTLAALILLFYRYRSPKLLIEKFRLCPWTVYVGAACLGANYFTFMKGLELGGPLTAAILIQFGPLVLAVFGILVFKEKLHFRQMVAICVALLGFGGFYLDRLRVADGTGLQTEAAIYVIGAALFWVVFCIGQKLAAPKIGASFVNFCAYGVSAVLLFPFVDWNSFHSLLSPSFFCIVYLSAATLVGYGALSEAIRLLPVSLVSLLIVTNPIVTIIVVELFTLFHVSYFESAPLSWVGYLGTLAALAGVAVATIKSPR